MEVIELLESASTMVHEARGVPLSASCVLHRGELLEILSAAKDSFPSDLAKAQNILEEQDDVLEEARVAADLIIERAREEVASMVAQTEIVASARREAQKILDDASQQARIQQEEIDTYVDSRLATLEVVLNKTLEVVAKGRDQLAGQDPKPTLSGLSVK
jgi:hypothetical protein